MAIVLETVARTDLAVAVLAVIDTGAGLADILFETGGDVEVATIVLQNPSFTESGGVLTMAGQPISDASATGNASPIAQYTIQDRDGADVLEGTVATSGGDINLTSLTVAATEEVELTTFTITVEP